MKNYISTYRLEEYCQPINFKKDLLFYEKVLLHDGTLKYIKSILDNAKATKEMNDSFNSNVKTIDFLIGRGYYQMFSEEYKDSVVHQSPRKYDEIPKETQAQIDYLYEEMSKIATTLNEYIINMRIHKDNFKGRGGDFIDTIYNYEYLDSRTWALLLSFINDEIYHPRFKDLASTIITENKREQVIKFVFNKMPIIDPDISWEELFEYKSDRDVQRKHYALINWANEVANSNLSIAEIKDKFEYLYREYEYQLNLHKKKKSTTTFQVILNSPLEAAENLVKLNFGKILSPFFNISKGKMDLLEAETKITGRELGYIFDVNEKFGK